MTVDQKVSNFLTGTSVVFGVLSLADAITFVVGIIVLIMAGVSNYYSMKKNKVEFDTLKKKKELEDEKQDS